MMCISLSSCEQGERIEKTSGKDSGVYEETFLRTFGDYSKINTWNTARQFSLDIIPGADGIVKIYAPCNEEFRLVADYTRAVTTFTSKFDAPANSGYFVVALGDDLYYAMSDGQVSTQSPRAIDVKVNDEPLQWILAVENDFDAEAKARRGAGGTGKIDFDFNDLIIGIKSVVTDDGVSMDLSPLACGDNQPFYIHIKTNEGDQLLWQAYNNLDDCEFHQWFGIKDYTTGVNTGINSNNQTVGKGSIPTVEAIVAAMSGCHLTLPAYWTLSNYSRLDSDYKGSVRDVWGIYITVGTYKGFDFVKNNADYGIICSQVGAAPKMLLFPDTGRTGQWRWPCEGNNIGSCYSVFNDWLVTPNQEQYMSWHEWMFADGLVRERF